MARHRAARTAVLSGVAAWSLGMTVLVPHGVATPRESTIAAPARPQESSGEHSMARMGSQVLGLVRSAAGLFGTDTTRRANGGTRGRLVAPLLPRSCPRQSTAQGFLSSPVHWAGVRKTPFTRRSMHCARSDATSAALCRRRESNPQRPFSMPRTRGRAARQPRKGRRRLCWRGLPPLDKTRVLAQVPVAFSHSSISSHGRAAMVVKPSHDIAPSPETDRPDSATVSAMAKHGVDGRRVCAVRGNL